MQLQTWHYFIKILLTEAFSTLTYPDYSYVPFKYNLIANLSVRYRVGISVLVIQQIRHFRDEAKSDWKGTFCSKYQSANCLDCWVVNHENSWRKRWTGSSRLSSRIGHRKSIIAHKINKKRKDRKIGQEKRHKVHDGKRNERRWYCCTCKQVKLNNREKIQSRFWRGFDESVW